MRKLKKFVVFLLAVIFSIFSFACKPSGSAVDFTYFNTIIHVETHDFAISEQLNSSLENLFSSLEKEFDVNDENSDLYKFNHAVANEQIVVSKRFASLFNTARNFYLFTDFKFNPAIYPLIELWQFNNYPAINFEPPNEQQISSLLGDKIDVKNIDFNLETNTISKSITEISLDFGGILDIREEDGITYVIVQLFADRHRMIPSHKLQFAIGEGEVFLGSKIIQNGNYDPREIS